jgi:sugar phosphate isomerase/epimerase
MDNRILVFTKPWKDETLPGLAALVARMGFDGVELPVRDGYQVTPGTVGKMLGEAKKVFDDRNLSIGSVAGSLERETIEAMGKAGIPLLRICMPIDMEKGYFRSVEALQQKVCSLRQVLEDNRVKVGMQNHCGFNVGSALGLYHLLSGIPSSIAGAVLDFAHCGLDGEPVQMAYDIVKDNLLMVNFKSACRARTDGPGEGEASWSVHWVAGRQGLYSWKEAVSLLRENGYARDICMPAEYDHLGSKTPIFGEEAIGRAEADLAYLKSLMAEA